MRLRSLAALIALPLAAVAAPAQPPRQAPRLIVAISVDQLSADLFAQYRQHFTGGFRRLTTGVVFPAGYHGQAATETCPGHASILTGSRPSRTGIIANSWFNPSAEREDKRIYCAEDEHVPGSSSDAYTVSPAHLRVPTLGDLMRRADPASRVVAVAGKDRAAVMMGGHAPSERWWWGGTGFVSHEGAAMPAAVERINAEVTQALSESREAALVGPVCQPRRRSITVAGDGGPVGDGAFAREPGDRHAFRASPELDGAVLRLAAALRDSMRLGEGEAVDLLAISASASDYVGHRYGSQGSEMCLQLLALDRLLGDLFARLDRTGVDYAVVLTADHGGLDIPERIRWQSGLPAERVDPALRPGTMGEVIGPRLGLTGPVLLGDAPFGDIYVDARLSAADRRRALEEAVRAYRSHPQVAAVFTRDELAAAPHPSGPADEWSLVERARASFDTERSGDFVVLLKPWVTPISDTSRGYVATHGSPWDYDRRVPILFWRAGMAPYEQPLPVEVVDILPTLAALIGLQISPGSVDGRCLDLLDGPETSCPVD